MTEQGCINKFSMALDMQQLHAELVMMQYRQEYEDMSASTGYMALANGIVMESATINIHNSQRSSVVLICM